MSLLLEQEEAERLSRRSSRVAGSTCFCLKRDRGLPLPSGTGLTSRATRTIPPVVTFGSALPTGRGRRGYAS